MAKNIITEIPIQAKPEKVWAILTDFGNYPQWNPFIPSIKGEVKPGNRIEIRIEPPNGKGMTFTPTVLAKVENKELRWLGKLFFSGLFDGEHKFELVDNGNGTVKFIQSEKFTGVFVGLFIFLDFFNPEKTQKGFIEMNEKLKALSEQ